MTTPTSNNEQQFRMPTMADLYKIVRSTFSGFQYKIQSEVPVLSMLYEDSVPSAALELVQRGMNGDDAEREEISKAVSLNTPVGAQFLDALVCLTMVEPACYMDYADAVRNGGVHVRALPHVDKMLCLNALGIWSVPEAEATFPQEQGSAVGGGDVEEVGDTTPRSDEVDVSPVQLEQSDPVG